MKENNTTILLEKEDGAKRFLPPRSLDPKIIANLLKKKPIKIKEGFCRVCNKTVYNTWALNSSLIYELDHLTEIGVLRDTELKILIQALEAEELKFHWIPLLSRFSEPLSLKTIIDIFFQFFHSSVKEIRLFLREIHVWRVLSSRERWYVSQRGNLYNPVFRATIYPWNESYNIARFERHHQGYYSHEYAKKVAFKMWYRDKFKKDYLTSLPKTHTSKPNITLKSYNSKTSGALIRYAQGSDTESISHLLKQLGYPTENKSLGIRIENFINKYDGYGIAIAEVDKKVVGCVAWSKSHLFVLEKARFHIEGLIVNTDYRGYGIGKKLMSFVEELAQKYKPSIIDLTTATHRAQDGTHAFYKKLGYFNEGQSSKIYLRKELS
jgi:ribosomal protein S18 acetylase RimI-like enzyme